MPQHAVHKEIAVPAQNKNQLSVSDSIRRPKFGSNTQLCDFRNFCNAWCSAAPDGSKQANGQMAHPKQRMKALPQRDVVSQKTGTFRSKHNWLCPTCRSEVSPKKQECSKCGCMRPNLGAPRVISAVQQAGNQWRNPESEHMKRFGRPQHGSQQRNNRSQRSVRNKQPKETIRYDNNNFMHKHHGDNTPVAYVAKKRMEKKAKTRSCECAALKAQFGWAMKCSLCRSNNNNKPAHENPNFGKGSPARKRQSPKFLTAPGMVLI